MQAHSNRYRLVYIQTQINNPHDLNTTLKQFSEVKDMFWVSFCFVVSVFRLHKMAILLASASSPPGILCGSQHSPQQLGDALHHQQMGHRRNWLIPAPVNSGLCSPVLPWRGRNQEGFSPSVPPEAPTQGHAEQTKEGLVNYFPTSQPGSHPEKANSKALKLETSLPVFLRKIPRLKFNLKIPRSSLCLSPPPPSLYY